MRQKLLLTTAALSLLSLLTSLLPLGAVPVPRREPGEADAAPPSSEDWPWWRGPTRNGVAPAGQKPPLRWSETENVLWKSPIPGRGHGSPIVVGEHVFVTTADPQREAQSVLCYHRSTGKQLWETIVHKGPFDKGGHPRDSMASTTPACDGQRVFVNFIHKKGVHTTALDRNGNQLWQTRVANHTLIQGFGSSPAIYQSLVIVAADNQGGGAIAGLDRTNGQIVWKHDRPKGGSFASPIILHACGRDQLVMTGCNLVSSYEPLTGKKLWETNGSSLQCITSTITDGKHIFTSAGFGKKHVSAVLADGSGKMVWENTTSLQIPSMLTHQGFLYAVLDTGACVCWKADTGKEAWQHRFAGRFSASPVLVGDHVYATNETGRTYIYKADPQAFKLVAENQLGEEVVATPAICGDRIYMRVAKHIGGQRQEILYCLGQR